jgi:hypothetical protein
MIMYLRGSHNAGNFLICLATLRLSRGTMFPLVKEFVAKKIKIVDCARELVHDVSKVSSVIILSLPSRATFRHQKQLPKEVTS